MKFATSDKINRSEGFISAVSGPSSHRNLATPLKKSVHGVRIPLVSSAAKKGKSNQLQQKRSVEGFTGSLLEKCRCDLRFGGLRIRSLSCQLPSVLPSQAVTTR